MQHNYLPMNAAALMDRVFDLYKATFKMQIAFSLIIGIISLILMVAMGIALAIGVGAAFGVAGYADDRFIVIAVVLVLIGILPLYLGWVYLSASGHILISKQAFYGEPIELPLGDTFAAFLRIMSAALAHLILSAPWFILLAFGIYFVAAGQYDILYFFLDIHPLTLIFGGLAFSLLYIIYSNIFALSIPVAIFERRLFFSTVTRSLQLLKGDFWRVLGLRTLWVIVVYIFSYSAQGLVLAIVGFAAASAGNVVDLGQLYIATSGMQFYVSLFAAILLGPMEGILTALIYFNQKIKKDGLDIEIGLDRLSRGYTS